MKNLAKVATQMDATVLCNGLNLEIRPLLERYPLTSDSICICMYFKDESSVDLGSGIASVYFTKGNIEYERYQIDEYTSQHLVKGKHFIVNKESYSEALKIVRQQGMMMNLSSSLTADPK